MVYAIASWISLFSVEAAFFIDARIRDVYEAGIRMEGKDQNSYGLQVVGSILGI